MFPVLRFMAIRLKDSDFNEKNRTVKKKKVRMHGAKTVLSFLSDVATMTVEVFHAALPEEREGEVHERRKKETEPGHNQRGQ